MPHQEEGATEIPSNNGHLEECIKMMCFSWKTNMKLKVPDIPKGTTVFDCKGTFDKNGIIFI